MRKLLLLSVLFTLFAPCLHAANSGWLLYTWSDSKNQGGDLGQFQTTDVEGVFVLKAVQTAENRLKFCVRNGNWSTQYAYSQGEEGKVWLTGTDVSLGTSRSANGLIYLAAGTYDVTFNLNNKTIRFDIVDQEHEEYQMPDLGTDFLRGGDVSMLNYVEGLGAKFYTADDTQKDPLDIMTENGCNIVRLRLYNNPGASVTYGGNTYKVPEGYLNDADVLNLARRVKEKGLRIELSFHYSDFWTNGMEQFKPRDWQSLTFDELKQAVYNYTKTFLQHMVAQGTTPEFISLGNEIQNGMLFGYNTDNTRDAVSGYSIDNQAALLNEGVRAVREVCQQSKIVLHFTMNSQWKTNLYVRQLNLFKNRRLDYDIIGVSYYPFWTNERPSYLNDMANTLWQNFQKPMLIMETGYSWDPYRSVGRNGGQYKGQLELNGTPYNEASKEGQKSFMQEVNAVVKGNSHILGYLYWDPIMVDQKVGGRWIETAWAMKYDGSKWWQDGNVVSNTTWFDFDGKALPVLEAIKEAAPTGISLIEAPSLLSERNIYTLSGQKVKTPGRGLYIIDGRKVVVK